MFVLKKTLLVINSSGALLEFARRILERAGYTVYCAEGITGAREHLADHTPDGVVLDAEISDGTALDFCRELRERIGVPVLLMSGDANDELPALLAGANDFLKRTSDYSIIKARISNMLNTKADPAEYAGLSGESYETASAPPAPAANHTGLLSRVLQKKTGRHFWHSMAVTALCILVSVVGLVFLYTHGKESQGIDIPPNSIPLAAPLLPDENAVPYSGDVIDTIEGPGCLIPCYERVNASVGERAIKMILLNPETNTRFFTFEILLETSGNTIFKSGLVAPGMCIALVESWQPLPTGEHDAVLEIRVYESGSLTETTGAKVAFTIAVS